MPRSIPRNPLTSPFPRILDHTDWRVFLRAWFQAHRRAFKIRGIREFALAAGCAMGQVNNALRGRRFLQGPLVEGFGRAAALDGVLLDYWRWMVYLSEEAAPSERAALRAKMDEVRAQVGEYPHPTAAQILAMREVILPLEGSLAERLAARWIQPVLNALASCPDLPSDLHRLVSAMHRRATLTSVRQALAELVALGLLGKGEDGTLRPTGNVVEYEGPLAPASYQLRHEQDLVVARELLYKGGPESCFVLMRDHPQPEGLSQVCDAMVDVRSEVGTIASALAGAGWCTVQSPLPPEGAPRPDRVLEVATAVVPLTREAPAPALPEPPPLVRRGPGRPRKQPPV